jgi:hydroxymethylbilane synthase
VTITTTGDKFLDVSLDKIGGKGLFIKEIEEALLRSHIDMAVHSMKDMPGEIHEELVMAAYSNREDASDCFINNSGRTFDEMPEGSIIGTSSLRRMVQIKVQRPDLNIVPLRGNVLTRLRRLDEGEMDAIILASAGIIRLGLEKRIVQRLPKDKFVPAVCQGIIGVQISKKDAELFELLKAVDSIESKISVVCERAFMIKLNGSCQIPLGAYSEVLGNEICITGMMGDMAKACLYKDSMKGKVCDAEQIGNVLAERILAKLK